METIKITSNRDEMAKIGKSIYEEKKDTVYTARMMDIIEKTMAEHIPDASDDEKEEMFYCSVYDYWVYGANIAEEFYFDFKNKNHEEKLEYITFRGRFLYINHLNSQADRHFLDNKWEAYQLLKPYYRRDAILIKEEKDYKQFSDFTDKHSSFVVKPVGLGAAAGVHKVTVHNEDEKRKAFSDILLQSQEFQAKYPWGDATSTMVEELIIQDKVMASLHPESVQSIRLVTIKFEDRVHIWYPRMDIGRNGGFLINGAAGGIMAVIDPKTGVIINKGIPESGEHFEYHPDTGVKIKGFQIPRWDELIQMANEVMSIVPNTRYVGWDMALSEKGWCVVEGNWAGEFVGDQLGYGRGLKKELEELIGWKPEKQFWWQS